MNYKSMILVGEVIPLTMNFIKHTNIKKFMFDGGDMLINYVYNKISAYNISWFRSDKQEMNTFISENVKVSLVALNNLYDDNNTHSIFLNPPSKDFLTYTYGPSNVCLYEPDIKLLKYTIISILIDLLEIDKRLLIEDDDWVKIIYRLHTKIITLRKFGRKTPFTKNTKYSLEQYIDIPKSSILTTKNNILHAIWYSKHNHRVFDNVVSSIRLSHLTYIIII